jgi:hypothetical protein
MFDPNEAIPICEKTGAIMTIKNKIKKQQSKLIYDLTINVVTVCYNIKKKIESKIKVSNWSGKKTVKCINARRFKNRQIIQPQNESKTNNHDKHWHPMKKSNPCKVSFEFLIFRFAILD